MSKRNQLLFITFLLCLSATHISSQESIDKKTYFTQRIHEDDAPKIDGKLNDDIWNSVPWGNEFTESSPAAGTPPTHQSRFKIMYDHRNLYVGLQCFDTAPDSIVRRLSRKDGFLGDRINLVLDSNHDKQTGFIFTITAAGVKGDEIITDNGKNIDASWNPIWYADAHITDTGWTGEMKIPLSQLRFGKSDSQVWGLNISRAFFRKSERSAWNPVRPDAPGFVSECGELHGLKGIQSQRLMEVQPFIVAQADRYPKQEGNPFKKGQEYALNAGLDAKIGITNNLTLDLTFNPDFGQVEADPGAIALDGFQLFFNEQRPFFIENKNIFNFNFASENDNVFYSRRIGRTPQRKLSIHKEGQFINQPSHTTILGAAKFSGKTNNGWSIGVLESVTATEYATIAEGSTTSRTPIEPLTNYFVGRTQKEFNDKNTYIGGILTSTHRFDSGNNFNSIVNDAITGGIDFRHLWQDKSYYVKGNIIGSLVTGSLESIQNLQKSITHLYQRSDATHLSSDPTKESMQGTGGKLEIGKLGTGNWVYEGGVNWLSPGLELNDIGFLRKADEIEQYTEATYKTLQPNAYFRSININAKTSTKLDFSGTLNLIDLKSNNIITWLNNWETSFGAGYKPIRYNTSLLRGGPRFRESRGGYAYIKVTSDKSRKLWASLGYVYGAGRQKNFIFKKYEASLNYQPLTALGFSLSTTFRDNPNRTQYISTEGGKYILGAIDNNQLDMALRINYSINPELSIQYYASPFYARGLYSDFGLVADPYAEDINTRMQWFGTNQVQKKDAAYFVDLDGDGTSEYTFGNPDFSFVQFRSNLVLRWEYIPGSEFFLVYAQGSTEYGQGRNTIMMDIEDTLLRNPLNHTFLVKYTYRFRR